MRLYMVDPDNPERLLKIPPHVFKAIHDDGYEEGHADGHDEGYYAGLDDAEVIVMETIAQPHTALTRIRALRAEILALQANALQAHPATLKDKRE